MISTMLNRWYTGFAKRYRPMDPRFNTVAQDQTSIGWELFLNSFIATSMVEARDEYYRFLGSLGLGSSWLSALCTQLWKLFELFWNTCNTHYHEHSDTRETELQDTLSQAISSLYNKSYHDMPPLYATFFHVPLQKLLQSPIAEQKIGSASLLW